MERHGLPPIVFLDTHIVVWLYEGLTDRLSEEAKELIEDSELKISSMVLLELQYLHEIKRIKPTPHRIFDYLNAQISLMIDDSAHSQIIFEAIKQTWTRDVFDRIIVATAHFAKAPLITADRLIHQHYAKALI